MIRVMLSCHTYGFWAEVLMSLKSWLFLTNPTTDALKARTREREARKAVKSYVKHHVNIFWLCSQEAFQWANSRILHPQSFNSSLPLLSATSSIVWDCQLYLSAGVFLALFPIWRLALRSSTHAILSLSEKVRERLKPGSRSDSSGLEGKLRWGESVLLVYAVWNMFLTNSHCSEGEKRKTEERGGEWKEIASLFLVIHSVWT